MFRFLSGHPPMMQYPRHHHCAMDPRFQEAYYHIKKAYRIMNQMRRPRHHHHHHRHPHRPPYCRWDSPRMYASSSADLSSSRYSTSADN
jgi:hypothetical protein